MNTKHLVQFCLSYIACYAITFFGQQLLKIQTTKFVYTLEMVYLFFFLISIAISWSVAQIKKHYETFVGLLFVSALTLKMIFTYLLLRPVLEKNNPIGLIEKTNIVVILLVTIGIDVFFAIKLINEKKC